MNLDLTPEDIAILRDALRSYLGDLHDEIAHTESFDFREALQERQRRLVAIADQLGGESS